MCNRVTNPREFPDGMHRMRVMTYAELDAGKLPEKCWYYEQVTPEGKRYASGAVLVVMEC
jgi:hypothetical protein